MAAGFAFLPITRATAVVLVIGVIALALSAFLLVNAPGGPTEETAGVVEASYFVPSNVGPPTHQVSVRLGDGRLVQAQVLAPATFKPGQTARVRIYRHVITGTPSYEAFAAETKYGN
jgi:hypothetical protein